MKASFVQIRYVQTRYVQTHMKRKPETEQLAFPWQ